MPRSAHPEVPTCPFFWRLLPFWEACWGPKNLQFPAATDKAGCWPKYGSRLTPCGQVILFRNSSRISLLMPFWFFLTSGFIPPNPGSSLAKPSSSQQGPAFLNALKSQGLRKRAPKSQFRALPSLFCVPFCLFSPVFILGVTRAAPSRLTPAPPPPSSAAGAGGTPGARKSTGCSQNLASMNPGCLLNRERNCVGFPPASPPHPSRFPQQPTPQPQVGRFLPEHENSSKKKKKKELQGLLPFWSL